jgi:hypothetical protein
MDWIRIKATTPDGVGKRYVRCDRDGRLETIPQESRWLTATIDKGGTTSNEVDLGVSYKELLVLIPTIDSATTTVHIAKEAGGTYYPLYDFFRLNAADTIQDAPLITKAASTSHSVIYKIGGARFIKIVVGASQTTAEVVFYVKGIN